MLKQIQNIAWLKIILIVSVVGIDQISKYLIKSYVMLGEVIPLFSYLNFYLIYNPGITFGFLSTFNQQYYSLSIIHGLCNLLLVVWIYAIAKQKLQMTYPKLYAISYATTIGGGLSNFCDRILQGKVTDFIDFHIGTWHYPTFNLADTGIMLGFLILCILLIIQDKHAVD